MNKLNRNNIKAYSGLELLARQVVEGFITGLHKSPFHGFSVEFAEHRQYNNGESTRHIDWKLFARTEKLFVKRYEEETNLRCRILIDNSPSMYFPYDIQPDFHHPDKITFAVYAAAAIIEMLQKQRDAVGLTLFAGDIEVQTPVRSNSQHVRMLFEYLERQLEKKKPLSGGFTDVAGTIDRIANTIHKRSLVIIFSDMFDQQQPEVVFNALRHLKYNKHEVILFHITDSQKELEFDYKSRPYRFIDLETGETLKFNPAEVRENYIEAMRSFKDELKLKCGQYSIDFVEVDINKGFNNVLLPYFLKRKKLY